MAHRLGSVAAVGVNGGGGRLSGPSRRRHSLLVVNYVESGSNAAAKRSKVELMKERSNYLRSPVAEELRNGAPQMTEEASQILKFHGIYQQDDRDRRAPGRPKAWQFMMRTRQPAGIVHPDLYRALDDLSREVGNDTLRITTRQTFQMHGILKDDLKKVISTVIRRMGNTAGTCGDINRNVIAACPPLKDRTEYQHAQRLARDLNDLLLPQCSTYYDIWLDGEKLVSVDAEDPKVTAQRLDNQYGTNIDNSEEPIYGALYLPRKFKIAITVPGDNSSDILTNDVAIIVMGDKHGDLDGYNVLVGGGLGRTHRNEDTFPVLAQPLGFVEKDHIMQLVKAIVATQRDNGRRDDRRQARMKYLVHDWGIDKFRREVERHMPKGAIQSFRPLPAWHAPDYLGWRQQGDGRLFCGVFIPSGRIAGDIKHALRTLVDEYDLELRLTPQQNILLCNIDPEWESDVLAILEDANLHHPDQLKPVVRSAMACPALPTCPLAISEAERALPGLLETVQAAMARAGVPADQDLVVRITGCPNGCSRPYMAELGFVGDGPNTYQIWVGGDAAQTRLATPLMERLHIRDFDAKLLDPLLAAWWRGCEGRQRFGDWCNHTGIEQLKQIAAGA